MGMLNELRAELGEGAFDVVDHWDTDACAVGIARPDDHGVLVYISTHDHRKNQHYWVSLELPAKDGDDAPYVSAGDRQVQGIQELVSVVREHLGSGPAA